MKGRSFSLKPFPSAGPPPNFRITGAIGRSSRTLSVRYALAGPRADAVIPAPSDPPARKNGLWEETCFEFFISPRNEANYWEFNLSPAGHWNVYRFISYRQGMQEEPAFMSLPFSVRNQPEDLSLSLQLNLTAIVAAEQALDVAVSAVIKTLEGGMTYWALTQPGPQPDFHRRDSFILEL